MKRKILIWEFSGFFFILLTGTFLHFIFELSSFWRPAALFGAVNESTWEHLKMVFWPGLFFFLLEYQFLKDQLPNYWTAKGLSLILMPLIIAVGWYGMVGLTDKNIFSLNIALFVFSILVGQMVVSYWILTSKNLPTYNPRYALFGILLITIAFASFTFFPPKIFLFEHMDLENTGQYGILKSYDGLLIFGP